MSCRSQRSYTFGKHHWHKQGDLLAWLFSLKLQLGDKVVAKKLRVTWLKNKKKKERYLLRK